MQRKVAENRTPAARRMAAMRARRRLERIERERAEDQRRIDARASVIASDALDARDAAVKGEAMARADAARAQREAEQWRLELRARERRHQSMQARAERVEALMIEIGAASADEDVSRALSRISQQMRDLRKRTVWYQRALALGRHVGDAYPPSVMAAVLFGVEVDVTYSARCPETGREMVDAADRESVVTVDTEALEIVREAYAVYETAATSGRVGIATEFAAEMSREMYPAFDARVLDGD